MLELRFVDAENRDFHDLTAALDEYYFMLVGEVEKRYAKYNLPHLFDCRIVAYEDGKPAGCARGRRSTRGHSRSSAFTSRRSSAERALRARSLRRSSRTRQSTASPRPSSRPPARPRIRRRCIPSSAIASFRTTQSGGRGKLPVL